MRSLPGASHPLTQAVAVTILALLSACGCGGGGGSSGGGNPPIPDFSLTVPASASAQQGESTSVNIGITAKNGFASPVDVALTGMPAGVTAVPSEFALSPGGQESVTITASPSAAATSST